MSAAPMPGSPTQWKHVLPHVLSDADTVVIHGAERSQLHVTDLRGTTRVRWGAGRHDVADLPGDVRVQVKVRS